MKNPLFKGLFWGSLISVGMWACLAWLVVL